MRAAIAADVVEMRAAIAKEKGDANPWDLKYAAGGLVDIEFIAQYLQLIHAATTPEILDTSTARTLEKAARLGVLKPEDAEVLRPAVRLFHDLTQILRLCLPTAFDPKTASAGVLGLLARAADLPDFPALQAHVVETQRQVRECFVRILGKRAVDYDAKQSRAARVTRAALAFSARASGFASSGKRTTTMVPCPSVERMRIDAAVHFDKRFGDGEAEARALVAFGQLAFDLLERPAELAQRVFRDADAVVGDGDGDHAAAASPAHCHRAAVGGELHGIGEQIERDLLQGAAVGIEVDVRIDLARRA